MTHLELIDTIFILTAKPLRSLRHKVRVKPRHRIRCIKRVAVCSKKRLLHELKDVPNTPTCA